MTPLAVIRQQSTVWVSAEDFTSLLKLGLKAAPGKDCMAQGVHGYLGETKVFLDRVLKKGKMRLPDDSILDVNFGP